MVKFDKQILLKTAKLSAIKITDEEIPKFEKELKEILKYFEELNNIKIKKTFQLTKNINVFREDKVLKQKPSVLLEIAPKKKDNYFVVPPMI